MFQITISGGSLDELRKNLEEFVGFSLEERGASMSPAEETQMERDLSAAAAVENCDPPTATETKRRGRPRKNEAAAAAVVEHNDPLPEALQEPAEQAFTQDDIVKRTQAIINAHKDRGKEMAEVVEYVKKLFAPFAITKAKELQPDRFVEFMATSQAYLDGTA